MMKYFLSLLCFALLQPPFTLEAQIKPNISKNDSISALCITNKRGKIKGLIQEGAPVLIQTMDLQIIEGSISSIGNNLINFIPYQQDSSKAITIYLDSIKYIKTEYEHRQKNRTAFGACLASGPAVLILSVVLYKPSGVLIEDLAFYFGVSMVSGALIYTGAIGLLLNQSTSYNNYNQNLQVIRLPDDKYYKRRIERMGIQRLRKSKKMA